MTELVTNNFKIIGSTINFTEDYPEPNGARLLGYWQGLKGERERPLWSQFDFLDIIDIASFVIIKDVIDNGAEFRNRFWGTKHVEMDRFDGTGKLFSDIYKPDDVLDLLNLYRQPLINALPMVMRGTVHYQEAGKGWRQYSSLCVGFTNEDGTVTHLVSAYDNPELG